jgi:hypothetical protein
MSHDESGEKTTYNHPSYGIVQFNRVQSTGGRRLFGSSLSEHRHTVRLTLSHCERVTSHGMDRFYEKGQVITVELSAAQFAESITAMNVGDGVPCTIVRLAGVGSIEEPPEHILTADQHAKVDFATKMKNFAKSLVKTKVDVEKATEGSALTKASRELIRGSVAAIVQEVGENIPYFIELYQEATTKIVTAAKADADAWLTTAIHRAGLQSLVSALAAGGSSEEPALLPESTTSKNEETAS